MNWLRPFLHMRSQPFQDRSRRIVDGRPVGRRFRARAGSVEGFLGSAVTYDIRAKASILGVDGNCCAARGLSILKWPARWLPERRGCIGSRGMATALLDCRPRSGRPSPDGNKPAGLAYVGCFPAGGVPRCSPRRTEVLSRLQGDRERVRRGVVHCILQKLRELSRRFTGINPQR